MGFLVSVRGVVYSLRFCPYYCLAVNCVDVFLSDTDKAPSRQVGREDNQLLCIMNGSLRSSEKPAAIPHAANRPKPQDSAEELARQQSAALQPSLSPPVLIPSGGPVPLNSASSTISTQYSQFLESVRGFQPLLADLNASIASVTNSVSTIGANVRAGQQPNGGQYGGETQIAGSAAAVQRDGGSDLWLHSPVVMRSNTENELTPPDSAGESPNLKEIHQQPCTFVNSQPVCRVMSRS